MADPSPEPIAARRRIRTAEVLSVGSEITAGETRDTNAGELARSLTEAGVDVLRLAAIPDDLTTVGNAFEVGLERADLVVSTGGLGPTPDDMTREAIAQVVGGVPAVDPALERWLRALWARRGIPFPEANLKQAWLIPAATAIPNHNGTAPGWWVETVHGRLIVALPGPPREMRAMWQETVLPRLGDRGLGRRRVTRTYRLTGIGESQVADLLGEALLRQANPTVATYARAEAVDIRISAAADGPGDDADREAEALVEEAAAIVLGTVGAYVWAEGDESWTAAIGRRLDELGWQLATVEIGTRGSLMALLGDGEWLIAGESLASSAAVVANGTGGVESDGHVSLERLADDARARAGCAVGLAVRATAHGTDTTVSIGVVTPEESYATERLAFLGGAQGRSRAALAAAAVLLERLRALAESTPARAGVEAEGGARR